MRVFATKATKKFAACSAPHRKNKPNPALRRMKRKNYYGKGNDAFVCQVCGAPVAKLAGGYRNHCPQCLWCKHVDILPGDRRETCRGFMEPCGIEQHSGKGLMIRHRCIACGKTGRNKIAPDDDFDRVVSLSTAVH